MATELQKAAVEHLVGNGGKVTAAMRKAKYAEATINTPQKLTESKGFKEELAKYGLTEGLITKALVSDIKSKPRKRIMELNLGAEVLGMKKREPSQEGSKTVVAVQIIVNGGNNPQNRTNGEAIART